MKSKDLLVYKKACVKTGYVFLAYRTCVWLLFTNTARIVFLAWGKQPMSPLIRPLPVNRETLRLRCATLRVTIAVVGVPGAPRKPLQDVFPNAGSK